MVNTYYQATQATRNAGSTSITVGPARAGGGPQIAAGDLVLVVQMQDVAIDTGNTAAYGAIGAPNGTGAGAFEFVRARSTVPLTGGTLNLDGGSNTGLLNNYRNTNGSDTALARRYQVIRVPQYRNASLGAALTAPAWDGTTGGVVAIDVRGTLALNGGTINANGLGFRGGGARQLAGGSGANTDYRTLATVNSNGAKGESIAGTPRYLNNGGALLNTGVEGYTNGSQGRGAPANGGGGGTDGNPGSNDQNPGGGGGGNAGVGGQGGYAWCNATGTGCPQTGGVGGRVVTGLGATKIVLGGGGGSGSSNNGTGTPGAGFASSGAAGGGIVVVRAGAITGSGTINANGADANDTVLNDGSGGGGAGGSVLVTAFSTVGASLTVNARGGEGGTNTGGGAPHGTGGGGGGGLVVSSFAVASNVSGGAAGLTSNGTTYGAAGGNGGSGTVIVTSDIEGVSSGAECTPVVTKSFVTSPITIGGNARLNVTVTNRNPTIAMTAVSFADAYPAAVRNTAAPGATVTGAGCSGTVTAAANGGSLTLAGGTVPAGGSCVIGADVTATGTGDHVNSIAAGDGEGTFPGGASTNTTGTAPVATVEAATATLSVLPPLTAVKSSQAFYDPVNGFTNARRIPGGFVAYTITVTNPSSQATDADSVYVMDRVPPNTRLFVGDVNGAGTGPVVFTDETPASGLIYTYGGLANVGDDVEFSNLANPDPNNPADWAYQPTIDANLVDADVTHIRVRPKGSVAATRGFAVTFGVQVQ